ncbi:hypothetical protein CDD83_10326 [Cordyceps sp. RAO-2017]|nr:hypothetical protein CDD83_10326 [Cordyceps sp. RAO-2017]
MAICALPPSTVRLLGSSATIATPHDLVKELLENAIDAEATTVDISVSADALERLSVRDNGHGIAVRDLESLGRRAHTSKLRTFDELPARAGKTLGFRGEALACASSLSSVTVTTRAAGEPVATRLRLRPAVAGGGVQDSRPVSAPVGTTVQATQLFVNMPARRQNLLKERHRSLSSIKELLEGYAMARPHLRLSLRISDGGVRPWSYSPRPVPSVKEATLQIFGTNLAANCVHLTLVDEAREDGSRPQQPTGYLMDAFLPAPRCDVDAVRGKGCFISVDQRPVSASRGLPKKIARSFKSHFYGHLTRAESGNRPQASLFMQLDIRCPPGSYDANVSPMKDELLFVDESKLLECFEGLCRKLYGGEAASVATLTSPTAAGPPETRPRGARPSSM